MTRNTTKSNQSKHCSYDGGKRSGHGGAHDGGPALLAVDLDRSAN